MVDIAELAVLFSAKGFGDVAGQMDKVGERAGRLGRSIGALAAPVLLIGGLAARTFAGFEQEMARVGAVSQASAEDLERLEDAAREMGATTKFTATEAASALGFMAQAGLSVENQISALPSVLQLAASAGLQLGEAADIVTNVMSGMRLEVEDLGRVNDVLVTAFTSANTNLSQLGEAFKFAGPVAAAAGLSFEETAASLALMGNSGFQASVAGTALRGAITRMLNPSKEAADIMRELGVTATDAEGGLLPLRDIIAQFEETGLSAGDAMEIFGQRAGPAMLALVNEGVGGLDKLIGKMKESGGTAERIADAQMATFTGQMLKLKSATEDTLITLGESLAPVILRVAEVLLPLIGQMAEWINQHPTLTTLIFASAAALAVLAAGLIAFSLILPGLTALVALLGVTLNVAFAGIPLIIAAVVGLGFAVSTNFLGIRDIINTVWNFIEGILNSWVGWFIPGGPLIKAILFFKDNWRAVFDTIGELVENFVNNIVRPIFNKAIDAINLVRDALGKELLPKMQEIEIEFGFVGAKAREVADEFMEMGSTIENTTAPGMDLLNEKLKLAAENLKDVRDENDELAESFDNTAEVLATLAAEDGGGFGRLIPMFDGATGAMKLISAELILQKELFQALKPPIETLEERTRRLKEESFLYSDLVEKVGLPIAKLWLDNVLSTEQALAFLNEKYKESQVELDKTSTSLDDTGESTVDLTRDMDALAEAINRVALAQQRMRTAGPTPEQQRAAGPPINDPAFSGPPGPGAVGVGGPLVGAPPGVTGVVINNFGNITQDNFDEEVRRAVEDGRRRGGVN